ncbi:hypothetical protein PM082_020108 [Marasmius tenuissimus]|nr:hypothetical protein PM082_020108 [Marasmius tenuissimus]
MVKDLATQQNDSTSHERLNTSPLREHDVGSALHSFDEEEEENVVTTTIITTTTTNRKRPRTSNSGPTSVITVCTRRGKEARIHTRPSKRPRNSYNQTYLYLDPSENYKHGSSKDVIKPTYRDVDTNVALAGFLAEWMVDRVLGGEATSQKARKQVEKRSRGRFEEVLTKFNGYCPTAAVFLALHYVERAVDAGLSMKSGFGLNMSLSRGPTVEQLAIYVTWIFLVALLAAANVISSDKLDLGFWVETMHLEAHHIRTMHRQLTMMLDDQLTMSTDAWTDFVQSLLSSNTESSESTTIVNGLLTDILTDELHVSTYSSTSHSRFILDVDPEADDGEARSPEDIQHLATVLAILLTHTINVTFDPRGALCVVERTRKALEVPEVSGTEKKKELVVEEKVSCGSSDLERVFSPPAKPKASDAPEAADA